MPEIVFNRRSLGYLYIFFAVVFVALGLLFLLVALGMATDKSYMGAAGFAVGGLSWILGAPSMWGYWKSYRQNEVRIGSDQFSICTPAGKAYAIPYGTIRSVTYKSNWRVRQVVIDTSESLFTFDMNSCPKPATVAKLVAERSGHQLLRA